MAVQTFDSQILAQAGISPTGVTDEAASSFPVHEDAQLMLDQLYVTPDVPLNCSRPLDWLAKDGVLHDDTSLYTGRVPFACPWKTTPLTFHMLRKLASSLMVVLSAAGARAQALQAVWGQCGGTGWSGPTACVSGAYCFQQNQWYYQCLPGTATSSSSTSNVASSTPAATQPATTLITSVVTTTPVVSSTPAVSGGGCRGGRW
ncbi:hypothetical protein B0T17DRAFT_621570 [Bombardia bombarda]|uniref:CBM1 domain-containing protein n=1 Tax=Bombardia bombarda TaxID=252184 RepID=A0AA39U2D1_9PEZI|nr:hypothetical protein B0T17DRAFT_621570 [Bombardia bombarda]